MAAITVKIKGTAMDADLDEQTGEFSMSIADRVVRADTLRGLRNCAESALRQSGVTVEVPFSSIRDDRVRHGVGTGLNPLTNTVMVRWEDGTDGQLPRYGDAFRPLSQQETETYDRLNRETRESGRALLMFEEQHRIDLAGLVQEAVREAAGGDGAGA